MNKPPYRVPSMQEIADIPHNGYYAISTFSGCGGSSLGYKMAGFKMLWANEFIPAAQDTYRANHKSTILDTRDIRKVQVSEILESIKMQPGELDLFDGSPPCASFSTAGKREAGWGKVKDYSDTKQRTDDLFFEFTRLVSGVKPKTFVAENVSGLVKGTAKGYFLEILAALKDCGYLVTAKLLDAQWLGVPQMRQRIIFVGVRNDLVAKFGVKPAHPEPLPYYYSVRDALPWIGSAERDNRGAFGNGGDITNQPSPAILSGSVGTHWAIGTNKGNRSIDDPSPSVLTPVRQHTTSELTIVEAEADISRYAIGDEWDKLAIGEQSDKYFQLVKPSLANPSPTITQRGGDNTVAPVVHPTEKRKFSIAELKRICAFPDDFILTGTYAQQWERLGRAVPPVMMMHIAAAVRDGILCKIK